MKFFKNFLNKGKPSVVYEISDRDTANVSSSLTPQKVAYIMKLANSGDIKDQCKLADELLEKNADIIQAFQTRIDAVVGVSWSIKASDDSNEAKAIAKRLTDELEIINGRSDVDNFEEMIEDLVSAILYGFSVSEILWENGGEIKGFNFIEQKRFTFHDSYFPKLITNDAPLGVEIPPMRILYHRHRRKGNEISRSGLIRVLAWLHCFLNSNEKQLLSFIERYGMPFVVVKVDPNSFDKTKNTIKRLIRNFGSSGGALLSKDVEAQLLQAANSDGNIFFRLKESLSNSINQLILGQTASSGDSAGLSGGDAQSKVRQDILEADCRRISRTINSQLVVPWVKANYGNTKLAPKFILNCVPPEDTLALAQTLSALATAGLEVDTSEMSERFGMTLRKRSDQSIGLGVMSDQSDQSDQSDRSDTLNLKQKYDAIGVAIRAGLLTATREIEEQTRSELGLPATNDTVKKSWEATGGIRQPITLKNVESEAVADALEVEEETIPLSDTQLDEAIAKRFFSNYESLPQDDKALEDMSESDVAKCLKKLANSEHVNVKSLAKELQKELAIGIVEGAK